MVPCVLAASSTVETVGLSAPSSGSAGRGRGNFQRTEGLRGHAERRHRAIGTKNPRAQGAKNFTRLTVKLDGNNL